MAITNHERVGKARDLLKDGLQPFVEREMKAQHSQMWLDQARLSVAETQTHLFSGKGEPQWDSASLLSVMWNQWNVVFRKTLGQAERTLVSELRDVRNRWAHQKPFSSDDAYRALDSGGRLLTAVSAPQAEEVEKIKMELLRVRFDEQVRSEKRKTAGTAIESEATGNLKPWREVVTPHKDVASGRYQQAEFAADLWQVHLGEGTDEYKNPVEFFRRTYLTESLKGMLVGAVRRLSGKGGDPVVQLQTNFGGGKKAYARIKADDEKATSPGDALRELFNEYGPCLILIDEWVAYARQLHDQSDLPAGGFETQFTFAQVLTESAKLAKNCLLVISLPASDTTGASSPHTQANDVEVGGQRGREALDRLRNVVGRVESSWRPASAEEGFEIVRRRLFEPLVDQAQFKDRDVEEREFDEFYRTPYLESPPAC